MGLVWACDTLALWFHQTQKNFLKNRIINLLPLKLVIIVTYIHCLL